MADSFYKILDKNGIEIPDHYTGRRRTYEEAKKMVDGLNKNGKHSPYTMIEINGNMAQQTAVEWLLQIQLSGNGRLHLTDEEFKQALQMEKDQIVKAVYSCMGSQDGDGERYYEDEYGK